MIKVKGFEGLYSIDKSGNVYSHYKNKLLKPVKNSSGYLYVYLTNYNRTGKWYFVHRLVLLSNNFTINTEGKEVNHKDHNKENNCITNLEWVTHQENIELSYKFGRKHGGRKKGFKQTQETRDKMSQAKNKPVTYTNTVTGVKETKGSIAEVSADLGIYRKAIYRAIKAKKQYKEYKFSFA